MYGKSSYDELKDGQLGLEKIATAPHLRSEPTRAPAQGSIDAGADPGQASRKTHRFGRFWPHSAFLKRNITSLCKPSLAPWPKGPRPKNSSSEH